MILLTNTTINYMYSICIVNLQSWNADLAAKAQELANTCHFDHALTENVGSYGKVGQNLWGGTTDVDADSIVTAWYNEIYDYDYTTGACSAVCGHYTQVC